MTACTLGHHYADLAHEVVASMRGRDLPEYPVAFAIQVGAFVDRRAANMLTDHELMDAMRAALEQQA